MPPAEIFDRQSCGWSSYARALTAAVLLFLAQQSAAVEIELRAARQTLRIETRGGLPTYWLTCDRPCDEQGASRQILVGSGGSMRWIAAGQSDSPAAGIVYTTTVEDTPEALTLLLTAQTPGQNIEQRYELSKTTHAVRLRFSLPPGTGLQAATGTAFAPRPLPGFASAFTDVDAVRVSSAGQETFDDRDGPPAQADPAAGAWTGARSHFWAWLARPASQVSVSFARAVPQQVATTWNATAGELDLVFYAGPVEWKSLRVVAADLTQLLFSALWEPLRWGCFGLLFLLGFIQRWVINPGIAIIVLSLVVKIILYPLTRIAEGWQQEVNRIQARIQPRIEKIRQSFKGEEAHRLTLQAYREAGVHPLFTLKSLAGFAIQVPMFIAAFDMLADNYALKDAGFLWIDDLAAPDRFLALPFTLPFFGGHLNLLPIAMTLLTVLSALIQADASLTPALLRKQRRQLYLMAGVFFLLFYTFPAGMVLYWTANNGWHLLKLLAGRALGRRA